MQDADASERGAGRGLRGRLVLLAALIAVAVAGYVLLSDVLTLEALAKEEGRLRELSRQHPLFAYGVAFAVYAAITGLSVPGATVLTLAYGWFFGVVRAVLLVSFASTMGATIAFLLSRYLFRQSIQSRFGARLDRFNEALRRDGAFYLFTLRMIPAVPFFVINAVMGLTPMRAVTFWWVSQLGMLPWTAVYAYAGSSVPSLQSLADKDIAAVFSAGQLTRILIALVLLGLFPLAVRWAMRYFGMTAAVSEDDSNHITERTS